MLPLDTSSLTCRNHWDSLAPLQQISAVVAAEERDMPGIRLKVARN